MNAKRRFINQLLPGETLDQVFLVRDKDLRTSKAGDLYLTCVLVDKTGQLPARMWQVSESIYNSITVEGFLHVKGRTEDYRGSLQFIIDALRPIAADKTDLADFLPTTRQDIEKMWEELLDILRAVKDRHIRMLVKKFCEDRDLVTAFKRAPAAMQLHHAFLGGLLEHTLNVARLAKAVLPLYPKINADLLLSGAFLHDIGKTGELNCGTTMSYTDRGQLIGHITLATIWVAQKAQAVAEETGEPFPPRTLDLVQHLILAHHGEYEFGSPRLPAIPEAFVLHYLDNLDAKIYMTTHAIENDADPKNNFTPFMRELQTRVYKRSGELKE
jgi:3'-5' exoribonuclease